MKFNGLIPELSVSDIGVSKRFYLDTLGFELEYARESDRFAFISMGSAQMMIEEINGHWSTDVLQPPFGRGINFQIRVDDVLEIADRLKKNNVTLFRDVSVSHYECDGFVIVAKEVLVQDPDGYLLRFSEMTGEQLPKR